MRAALDHGASARMRANLGWALGALGLAAVILASREHAWSIGHWSQDLSPVPLLAGLALLSTALDRFKVLGGSTPEEGESTLGSGADMRRWHFVGLGLAATGLGLLGRSGLGLLLAAAMAGALALAYATGSKGGRG